MRLLLTAFAASLLALSNASAQPVAARLQQYMSARARLGQFNGSVLVAQNGKILLEQGYGLANVEHQVRATAATRYEIASITKNFTAAAILRLQEERKLSVDDSLCHWVTACPAAWQPVTIAHLLHHTSGIPDYEAPLDLGSPAYLDFMVQSRSAERILDAARSKPLDFAPGSKFQYSNTAYILLGTIIERASGKPFQQFLRERVLGPARIPAMQFVSGSTIVPRIANAYAKRDFGFARTQAGMTLDDQTLNTIPWLPLDGPHADANLVATPHDLWQWTQALSDSTALSPASIRYMLTPGLGEYGTGWFIGTRFGQRTASHTGLLPGFASVIEWYPDSRTVIILMTNVDGIRLSITQRDLAAIVFGKPYDLPVARKLIAYDSVAMTPLVGEYALNDGSKAVVSADKTMLVVQVPGRFTAGAFPLGADAFYAPFFDNTVRFDRPAKRILLRINGETLTGTRK